MNSSKPEVYKTFLSFLYFLLKFILFQEIKIPTKWGCLAGLWYGPKDSRPIIAFHGRDDNSGTFSTIAPYITKDIALLAIDFPGHGASSHYPDGINYYITDFSGIILLLMDFFKWDKVSLIGHSMGAVVCFIFASIFPDKVDVLISIDTLKPPVENPSTFLKSLRKRIEYNAQYDSAQSLTSFTSQRAEDILFNAFGNLVERKNCRYLLDRLLRKSDLVPGHFVFGRDNRVKFMNPWLYNQEQCMQMASQIKAPYLAIKAKNFPLFEDEKYHLECLNFLKENHSQFEYHEIEGTHYLHLNDPKNVSEIINPFIRKWGLKPERL